MTILFGKRDVFLLAACLIASVSAQPGGLPITRDECIEKGGEVVGDIGNGAIFDPDYVCENSGLPPTDIVKAGEGEPIAIEGEVCCGGDKKKKNENEKKKKKRKKKRKRKKKKKQMTTRYLKDDN